MARTLVPATAVARTQLRMGACGRDVDRDLRPVAESDLPKADRGGNARVGGFGRRIERRAENAVADIRGAVFCDDRVSANVRHNRVRHQEGRQCVTEIKSGLRACFKSFGLSLRSRRKHKAWGVSPCHYSHFDEFLARGCGRQHKAWGGALAEPQEYDVSTHQAREAGGSFLLFVIS